MAGPHAIARELSSGCLFRLEILQCTIVHVAKTTLVTAFVAEIVRPLMIYPIALPASSLPA